MLCAYPMLVGIPSYDHSPVSRLNGGAHTVQRENSQRTFLQHEDLPAGTLIKSALTDALLQILANPCPTSKMHQCCRVHRIEY